MTPKPETQGQMEERILRFWKQKKIYEKAKKKIAKGKKFYFLDGPPYASGDIHVGTAMNKVLKDFYIRFFRMKGFNVWDQPGYDTHGLPIENKVEKKLGFQNKQDIERFGVDKFVQECRKFATQYIDVMSNQFADLGVWMDWSRPYLTLDNDYIEGAWFTFKKAFENGFLYKGTYSVHVCPHCGTAVAYNEIEYEQVTDPSIFVKFRIQGRQNEFLVVWTTTPWTIPSNTGVMVNPKADYDKVKVGDETLIIANRLVESVMSKAGVKDYEILETVRGKDLEGLKYDHPLKDIFLWMLKLKNAHRVVLSEEYVSLEEGTGLVHTAPGHGKEDHEVGLRNGLPIINPLDLNGKFNQDSGKFSGLYVKTADKLIIEELRERNSLLAEEKVTHDYPMCWRCDTPLLQMAVPQWFFKVTAIRNKLIEENKKVKWMPEWASQRFENWLESLGDWPISRQRYWGIPLPIWVCQSCDSVRVIGSRKELPRVPKDFHKPYIDLVELKCSHCKGIMKRVPDVLDVWFDSGVAPWASLGYPNKKELFEKLWPVDFILEGSDQIRGWWNSLMITSMMTFGRRSFNSVLFHGFVLDVHGVKMSKSKGNIVIPVHVRKKHGIDILRYYYLTSIPWEDYYFKVEDLDDIARSFVIVKNVFNFVKTYVTSTGKASKFKKEDLWILSKLNSLISENSISVSHETGRKIMDFILNDFSRWYVKIIRDRVWPNYKGKDKQAAMFTLFKISETVTRMLAPITPFIAEHFYQTVIRPHRSEEESVHLLPWPRVETGFVDKKLEQQMEVVKKIFEASQAARQNAGIKLRWPVSRVVVFTSNKNVSPAARNLKDILLSQLNTKKIQVVKKKPKGEFSSMKFDFGEVFVEKKMDQKLKEEAMFRELVREIQDLRKKNGFNVKQSIILTLSSDKKTEKNLEKWIGNLKDEVGARNVRIGKNQGKYKGKLSFMKANIEIAFS